MQVVEKLNLAGLDHVYVCTAISSKNVVLTQCALRLKKSGTVVPRMELVEVGPSMDLVVRRHRLPNESLRKEAMREGKNQPKKVEILDLLLISLVSFACNMSVTQFLLLLPGQEY